jgi:hypothetical protein
LSSLLLPLRFIAHHLRRADVNANAFWGFAPVAECCGY